MLENLSEVVLKVKAGSKGKMSILSFLPQGPGYRQQRAH